MITVPVSAATYQALVSQGGGLTFHSAEGLGGSNAIQLIGTPLQLGKNYHSKIQVSKRKKFSKSISANGQIIAKVETSEHEANKSSIQNLVTKVMGSQSIHSTEAMKPATLTITPVMSSASGGTIVTNSGPVLQMVGAGTTGSTSGTRLRSSRLHHHSDQPDTTESLD